MLNNYVEGLTYDINFLFYFINRKSHKAQFAFTYVLSYV